MKQLVFAILLFIASTGFSQTTKVLFIGNSYTGNNNLPETFKQIAKSAGDTVLIGSHTPGGRRFFNHSQSQEVYDKIRSQKWDYIVLQEQSQIPSFSDQQVEQDLFPYAKILVDSIKSINECTEVVFYMTWGRENGDASNCKNWPPVCTYEGMDSLLRKRYIMLAERNKSSVAPVGMTWNYCRKQYPNIDLYANDGSHPSLAGTYLAASTFYASIFRKNLNKVNYNFGLDATKAKQIRDLASKTVLDSLNKWRIGANDPILDINYQKLDGNKIKLLAKADKYDSIYWNVTNGEFDKENETIINVNQDKDYFIVLVAYYCGKQYTKLKTINWKNAHVTYIKSNTLKLWPNPIDSKLTWNLHDIKKIEIFDNQGRMILEKQIPAQSNSFKLDIKDGTYTVKLTNKLGLVHHQKIVFKK